MRKPFFLLFLFTLFLHAPYFVNETRAQGAAGAIGQVGSIAGGAMSAVNTWDSGVDCVEAMTTGGTTSVGTGGIANGATAGVGAATAAKTAALGAASGGKTAAIAATGAGNTAAMSGATVAQGSNRPIWRKCVTVPLHLLATVASFMNAAQSGQNADQTNAEAMPEGAPEMPADAPAAGADMGDMPTFDPNALANAMNDGAWKDTPFAQWDPDAAKDTCSKTPDVFICQKDPYAAIDEMKDNYLKAYEGGVLTGAGEGGLPAGETLDSVMSNFDQAKGQLSAMLSNTSAFKTKNAKKNTLAGGASAAGVSGNPVAAFKNTGTASFFSGLGKVVFDNGLDVVDDQTGKSLTLWQRATRRHHGTNSERALMMTKMELIRQNALAYLRGPSVRGPAVEGKAISTPALKNSH